MEAPCFSGEANTRAYCKAHKCVGKKHKLESTFSSGDEVLSGRRRSELESHHVGRVCTKLASETELKNINVSREMIRIYRVFGNIRKL